MIILTIFGVIMVFSSSSVNMIANGQSPWAQALKQGMYCVFGLVIAFITMMLPACFLPKDQLLVPAWRHGHAGLPR